MFKQLWITKPCSDNSVCSIKSHLTSYCSLLAVLLFLFGCTSPDRPVQQTGIEDLDIIRQEVTITSTDQNTAKSRRSALYRYYRFLWRQGMNMRMFDEVANTLLDESNSSTKAHEAIDNGYFILDQLFTNPVYVPEVKGAANSSATTFTNWPLYHGVDGSQSGYSPDKGPSLGEIVWKFPKTNGWTPTPVVSGNQILASGAGADVIGYSLDSKTGKVNWKARIMSQSYYHTSNYRYSPVEVDDHVFFKIGQKHHGFEKSSGKKVDNSEHTMLHVNTEDLTLTNVNGDSTIWNYQPAEGHIAHAIALGSRVFVANTSGTVSCLNKENGKAIWSNDLQNELRGKISVYGDQIFATSLDRKIFALELKDGSINWTQQLMEIENKAYDYFSGFGFYDNNIYFGTAAGYVYCLKPRDGSTVWKETTQHWIQSKPVKIDKQIFVVSLDGKLHSISENENQANLDWSKKISDHGFSSDLIISTDGIIATDNNMMVYSLDPKSGDINWKQRLLDGAWVNDQHIAAEEHSGQQSSPTIVDGILYIASPDGFVNAIDTETGNELWKFETKSSCSPSPTVAEGKVFVGQTYRSYGKYFALDAKSGEPIWSSEKLGSVWINAAYDNGRLFLGNMNGFFFAVNPNTGEKLWEYFTAKDTPQENKSFDTDRRHGWPPGVYCNPITEDGIVYTGSWSGYYFAFDQESGQLLWRTKTKPELGNGGLPDSAAPVLHKDHIYVQKAGHFIAAINKHTGNIDWEWQGPEGFLQNGTIAALDNRIFGSVARRVNEIAYHTEIIAFNDVPTGGEKVWSYRGGGGLTAPVVTDNKIIFGSSGDPFLTCLDPENGEVKWRLYVGGIMLESVPAIYGDKAFAQVKNGYLYAVK